MTGPEQHGGITARLVGDDVVNRALRRLAQRIEDAAPVMDAIGQLLEGSARRRITTTNRDPDGQMWKPSLRAQVEGGRTLEDQGHLRDSLTHVHSQSSVETGTGRVGARILHEGGVIRPRSAKALRFRLANGQFVQTQKVTMPRRRFLGVDREDRDDIVDLVTNALRRAVRA